MIQIRPRFLLESMTLRHYDLDELGLIHPGHLYTDSGTLGSIRWTVALHLEECLMGWY